MHIKLALKFLKNKKSRRLLFVGIILSLFLSVISSPVVTGIAAAYEVYQVVKSVVEFFTGETSIDVASVDVDKLIEACNSGYVLTEAEEAGIRMKQEDFMYMLQRVSDYNHAGEKQRTISVEYQIVTEEEDPETGETIEIINYDYKDVVVDNSQYEGLYKVDYRLIYFYIIESLVDTKTSNEVLGTVTPLDADLKEIASTGDAWKNDVVYASRERINRVFTHITMKYNYVHDVLRNSKNRYSFDESQTYPHTTESWSEDGGECTMYVPQTYLQTGSSVYSYLQNVTSGNLLTEVRENFNYDSLISTAEILNPKLTDLQTSYFFKYIGGKELLDQYKKFGNDKTVANRSGLSIYTVTGGSSRSVTFGDISDLGVSEKETMEYVFNEMLSWGFSEAMAAGACGNLWQESGFRTSIAGHGAYGIVQWMGGRKTNLDSYAESIGKSWQDIEAQTGFIGLELADGYLDRMNSLLMEWDGMDASTIDNVQDAADVWCAVYEGCVCTYKGKLHDAHNSYCAAAKNGTSYQHLAMRREYANRVYKAMAFISAEDLSSNTIPENGSCNQVVYIAQNDYEDIAYGSGTIASCGCGVVATAMALSYCKGGTDRTGWLGPVDVLDIIKQAKGSINGCYVSGDGSSHDIAAVCAEHLGLKHSEVLSPRTLDEKEVLERLRAGQVAVCSASRGYFTKEGHFIVISGCDNSGNLYVNDPNKEHSSYSYQPFSWKFLLSDGALTSITFITPEERETDATAVSGLSAFGVWQ